MQNAALILTMRYVRTRPGEKFFSTTAVVICETVKMITSLLIILFQLRGIFLCVLSIITVFSGIIFLFISLTHGA